MSESSRSPVVLCYSVQAESIVIEMKKLYEDAKTPFRKRDTDAGYDLYAYGDYILEPRRSTNIMTGIALSCPPGYYYTIEGRSSLWCKGIFPNRGIIDATYTGEVIISMVNVTDEPYNIANGDRVAQIILAKQYHATFNEIVNFSEQYSIRGTSGFGSSGK